MHTFNRSATLALAAVLVMAGCAGEDGKDGAPGVDGADGVSCTVSSNADGTKTVTCADGSVVVLPAATVDGKVLVSDQAVTYDGADVVITFKVSVNGAVSSAFTNKYRAYRHAWADATATTTAGYYRTQIANTDYTVTVDPAGVYTARFPGLATTVGATPTTFLISLNTGTAAPVATVVVDSPNGPSKTHVSDAACINCHGENVFHAGTHHGANPQGVGACIVCHVRADRSDERLGTPDSGATAGTAPGTRLVGFVHGIHNSHNMPDGVYSVLADGVSEADFAIGFPGYMTNCATCHDTAATLTAAATAPVKYSTCMSCHDSWDGFPNTVAGGSREDHRSFTAATNCATCHAGTATADQLADFHNGLKTERNGLIWDGADQSVVQGKRLAMKIESVTPVAGTLQVRWSATWDGAPVDPCNADVAAGPVFFGLAANATTGQAASNMSILQAYAKGNDWVNEGVGTSPGQPGAVATLQGTAPANNGYTTCAANVATTIATAHVTTATKGTVALQGKAQVRFAPAAGTTGEVIQLRSWSPTKEFLVADGSAPAVPRRQIVSNEKCLSCHLGSIYQHGGNRVDSVELCVTCHNPASSEQNNRIGLGVTAAEAYDGKPGQTYDLRTMLHAIHSAGATDAPLVYYRNMGIYLFGSAEALANTPNWPGTGTQIIYGSTGDVTRTHNFIEVHYPRPLNDCTACHVNDSDKAFPNQTMAVGVTVDVGGTTYATQTDDVLVGPSTASCMSCHQSGDDVLQILLQSHAYQNSWRPQAFVNGRDDLLGLVEVETCVICHGAGKSADFTAAHAK